MSQAPPIRSLAAIVFTDIVGYSALVNRDDANAMRLVKEHFALVREIAPRFNGKVIKTIGDSVHLELASAQAATACSIAIQQAHRQRNARVAADQQFQIRIGLHLGDVEHRDGDIYGDGVNIAARLQPLAPVGGIAISDSVRNQLRLDLRNRFTSRGMPTLKNIETPIELFILDGEALADIEVEAAAPEAVEPSRAHAAPRRRTPIVVAVVVAAALALAAVLLPKLRSTGPATDVPDKSIAVLPFANLSSDKEQEYFSDGIAEDLLNLLTEVQPLQVAARTSSFSFKGKDDSIQEIAKALHVAHVLQGSVRKSGNAVRITAQLVRAADGYQVWSQSWDRQLDDVFKIQDEIALAVVEQLKVRLLGEAPTAKTVDPRVYPLILQAEALSNQQSASSRTQAADVFEQALAIDPNEPRAWAGLARVYVNQVTFGERPLAAGTASAKEAANKALSLDPDNVLALAMLGSVAWQSLDLRSAAQYYERALKAEPGNFFAVNSSGTLLGAIGRLSEARQLMEYRVAHDAANPTAYHNLGFFTYCERRWDASIEASRTAIRLSPSVTDTRAQLGNALLVGKHDVAGAQKEYEAEPNELSRLVGLAMVQHAQGHTQESDATLKALIDQYGEEQPIFVSNVFAYRKQADRAFEWLEKAVVIRDPGLTTVLTDPLFDSLHEDPRWIPYLRKIGYAPEQIAKVEFQVVIPQSLSR